MNDAALQEALLAAAAAPVLVVASDYDGTLAPIVADPAAAVPHRPALEALVELAGSPGVEAVIVSGRSREALVTLTGAPDGVLLVGSHGSEWPGGGAGEDTEALVEALAAVADRHEGTMLEPKPSGAALHYRHAGAPEDAAAAAREAGRRHGARVIDGKQVVELVLGGADKGQAIRRVRDEAGGAPVVFFGDDTTDEDVFAALGPGDVGVKVGEGDTRARFRVADPAGVAEALRRLAGARR